MNAGRCIFASLALWAFSTDLAPAAHHEDLHSTGSAATTTSGGSAAGRVDDGTVKSDGVAGAENGEKTNQVSGYFERLLGTGPSNGSQTGAAPDKATTRNQSTRQMTGEINGNDFDGPIDTHITVNQGRTPQDAGRNKGGKAVQSALSNIKQSLSVRTGSSSGFKSPTYQTHAHDHPPKFPTKSIQSVTRNAIGAITQTRLNGTEGLGSSLRSATPEGSGAQPARQEFGVQQQGFANALTEHPESGGSPLSHLNLGGMQTDHPEPWLNAVSSVNGPNINGANMIRPGLGPVSLGGPAKVMAGVLNGSDFRRRHQ